MSELVRLHARELVRDKRYFWFALLFPFGMLGIFLTIGALVPSGPGTPDFTRTVVPMALFLAITGSALTVTSGSLAGMRERGLLRLLGTTPLGRGRLLLTHLSVRVVMVVAQAVALIGVAVAMGALEPAAAPAVLGVTVAGLTMFLAVGCVIGGRLRSPDAATNLGTLVQLGTLFLSGLTVPLWLLPHAVASVLRVLPSTFLADLLLSQMRHGHAFYPTWLSLSVMAATTAAFLLIAVRTFRWDQGDD
jgi:ABC-2 type transport system permease protein